MHHLLKPGSLGAHRRLIGIIVLMAMKVQSSGASEVVFHGCILGSAGKLSFTGVCSQVARIVSWLAISLLGVPDYWTAG